MPDCVEKLAADYFKAIFRATKFRFLFLPRIIVALPARGGSEYYRRKWLSEFFNAIAPNRTSTKLRRMVESGWIPVLCRCTVVFSNRGPRLRAFLEMDRSTFIAVVAGLLITPARVVATMGKEGLISALTLLSVPLELGGDWGGSPPEAVYAVLSRTREACLPGVGLLSDQQPEKLQVDNHGSGPPYIWLHTEHPNTAWIIVDIGARDWCKLAYQFGHELGHVLCNSWRWGDDPKPPSQWLEESVVEAFSIRGLALLAESWELDPPFPHDSAFAGAIRQYRANLLAGYHKAAEIDFADWLRAGRPMPENGVPAPKGPAVAPILADLEQDKGCVEDMGALNRWPEQTGLPIGQYLRRWQKSCKEINAPGLLPTRLRALLNLT